MTALTSCELQIYQKSKEALFIIMQVKMIDFERLI